MKEHSRHGISDMIQKIVYKFNRVQINMPTIFILKFNHDIWCSTQRIFKQNQVIWFFGWMSARSLAGLLVPAEINQLEYKVFVSCSRFNGSIQGIPKHFRMQNERWTNRLSFACHNISNIWIECEKINESNRNAYSFVLCRAVPLLLARVNILDLFIVAIHLEKIGAVSVPLHERYNPLVTFHVLYIVASLKSYFTIIVKAKETKRWNFGYERCLETLRAGMVKTRWNNRNLL